MADITESSREKSRTFNRDQFLYILYLTYYSSFCSLDETTAKSLLSLAGQKTSDTAVHNILNSDRYTGVMYILAYLAGVVALWNRHPYLWWFMFAVYVSFSRCEFIHVCTSNFRCEERYRNFTNLNRCIGSCFSIYMLVDIARKSTFNR